MRFQVMMLEGVLEPSLESCFGWAIRLGVRWEHA